MINILVFYIYIYIYIFVGLVDFRVKKSSTKIGIFRFKKIQTKTKSHRKIEPGLAGFDLFLGSSVFGKWCDYFFFEKISRMSCCS